MISHYKKLLGIARTHFEDSTGLRTKTCRLRLMDENWWEAHQGEDSTALATSSNYENEHVICLRESYMSHRTDAFVLTDILHELTHEFHLEHSRAFWALLASTGVLVGDHYNSEYRVERPSEILQELAK